MSRPLTMFAKALELHSDKDYHKTDVIKSDEFLKTMTNQQPDIRSHLNKAMADRISLNRQKLTSIFKIIVFCGRQNTALRGHRDDATHIERDVSESENHGNFRIDVWDTVLAEHLATADQNATYTSKTIQNQMIDILADQVRQKIVGNIEAAKWYTVVADEVTDVLNKEQLSLVLR